MPLISISAPHSIHLCNVLASVLTVSVSDFKDTVLCLCLKWLTQHKLLLWSTFLQRRLNGPQNKAVSIVWISFQSNPFNLSRGFLYYKVNCLKLHLKMFSLFSRTVLRSHVFSQIKAWTGSHQLVIKSAIHIIHNDSAGCCKAFSIT